MITEEQALEYEIGRAGLIKELLTNKITFIIFPKLLFKIYERRCGRYKMFYKMLMRD